MSVSPQPELDLTLSRLIKAPRAAVWRAWTDRASFEQWWVPAPARCRVQEMELHPGGSFATLFSEDGGDFVPHLRGCFLALDPNERLVFTNALVKGWRPAEASDVPLMTATITLREHAQGTDYVVHVQHNSPADRSRHEKMGFFEGWGTVTEQLARLAER